MHELTEAEVIATTQCTHPSCKVQPGRTCKPVGRFYEQTQVHRGRWLKAKRDREVPGRVMYAPE